MSVSIICREKVTQSVAAPASASPSPLVLEAWPWSPQWRWWSWWRLSYASVSHWPILLLLSHWSNSIWLLLSHWSKPICLSSHETVMVSKLSLIASLFCTRLLPTPGRLFWSIQCLDDSSDQLWHGSSLIWSWCFTTWWFQPGAVYSAHYLPTWWSSYEDMIIIVYMRTW